MLSVRWGERALPVAWRVEETDGAIGFAVQRDLLDAVRGWLPAEMRVTLIKAVQNTLRSRGRSLIVPSLSTALCLLLFLSPYQGHGSLRGRRLPPQRLVRSTGAAMSTTGSRATHTAQRPPSQLACTLAPVGNPHIRADARMDLDRLATRPEPALAPTSGTARLSARCCAGSRTACGPARLAPCRGLNALRSPAPNPSGLMPA